MRPIFFYFYTALFLMLGVHATPSLAQQARPIIGKDFDYEVAEDQELLDIATKFNLAIEHLAFANGYPTTSTTVVKGSALKVPKSRVLPQNPPRDGLVLNVPERGIFFYRGGEFQRFVPVSVGTPPGAKTPLGQFKIIEKVVDPTWYPPAWAKSRKPVPPGPENPLGTRWIGLSAPRVGIHGTNDPLNVGASVTHGCIRCYPDQVESLYNEVAVGMPVRIDYETAKIGKTPDGQLMIVTFPDIYKKQNSVDAANKLLKRSGYGHLVRDAQFQTKLKLNLGYPLLLEKQASETN